MNTYIHGGCCWNPQSRAQPRHHRTNEITDAHMLRVHYIPCVRSTLYKYITRSAYFILVLILCSDHEQDPPYSFGLVFSSLVYKFPFA